MTSAPKDTKPTLFSLRSGRPLLERICSRLDLDPAAHEEREFEDGEHKIRPLQDVRGRDVFVVESLYGDEAHSVNDKLVRLLFFLSTLRDAGAGQVTAVVPYLCYARKDRRTKPRDPVASRYLAALFEAAGAQRVVSLDVHNPAAYENAFRIPAEHLTAAHLLVERIAALVGDAPLVVVSPDAGGAKRAERFRQALERAVGRAVGSALIEKFRSEGQLRGGALAGDVDGRVAIIVDDLISSGGTLVRAAVACRRRGALTVHAAATHGVFSADASQVLGSSPLETILVLDTIPPRRLDPALIDERVRLVDCAPLLAEAIDRLHSGQSLADLTAEG